MTAVFRVHHALQAAGLHAGSATEGRPAAGRPERVLNAINEVWRCGDYMVRINPHRGSTRLQAEARLICHLPPEVHAPIVVGSGEATWGEWFVALRIPGQELSRAWSALRGNERRRAITELAAHIEALHHVQAPVQGPAGDPEDCPHPLPADRLLRLLADAADLPGVDRGIFGDAAERLVGLAPMLDEHPTTLIHGDLHLENVLCADGGTVTGLLDFEWSRPGPPDLDLDVLLHSLADPELHVESGGAPLHRQDFDKVVGWLRDAYPALFAHPHLAERLWVYRLAFDVHALLAQPPPPGVRGTNLPPHHPYQRILRLVSGRSDLGWFLAG